MKDPVFSGKDVADALRLAGRTLGLPESALRYVVLDPGQAGGRGLSATGARIAILIEKPGSPESPGPHAKAETVSTGPTGEREDRRSSRRLRHDDEVVSTVAAPPADVAAGIRELLRQFARATERELDVEIGEGRDTLDVLIGGAGVQALYDPRGETIASIEHLVERIYGRELAARRVRVRCEGYREYRDEVLREQALDLARQVLADGEARTTDPLNAYERRIVHVTIEGQAGLVTYSVGEGRGRRVTVASVAPGEAADARPDPATAVPEAAPPQPEAEISPAAPSHGKTEPVEVAQPALDYRHFDRPPQGGTAPELM